jgi:hypothetical protein
VSGPVPERLSNVLNICRALQVKQKELEKQQILDSLKKGLNSRPEKEELIERT